MMVTKEYKHTKFDENTLRHRISLGSSKYV